MLNLNKYEFGEPISINNTDGKMGANAMVSQFLNIKLKYHKHIKEIVKEDPHAARYFCKDDCAYIFRVEILKAIVAAIEKEGNEGKGCLVLFQGLKKTKEKDKSKAANFGQPTVIATAYAVQGDELKWIKVAYGDKKNQEDVDGFQHPGDGTGGTGGTPPNPDTTNKIEAEITGPVVEPGESHGDTDFVIKRSLKEDQLIGWL